MAEIHGGTVTGEGHFGASGNWARRTLFPLALILLCPPAIVLVWMTAVHFDGSLWALVKAGPVVWLDLFPLPTWRAGAVLGVWALLQLVLLVALPGKIHEGPVTPMGNRPRYKLNGVLAYGVTHAVLFAGAYPLGWFSPSIVYDELGAILVTSGLFALLFCAFLVIKGRTFPSSSDAGTSGNIVFDYYWGVELHPRLLGVDLKQYFNCRLAMMGWSVIVLSFAAKQVELSGHLSNAMAVSVGLQIAYIIKFFVWEGGYFGSLDIMHDRFGFYICWGVMAWLPGLYPVASLYLVTHPTEWPVVFVVVVSAFGLSALWANYAADRQRQRVRETDGETLVWGRRPEVIRARYSTGDGEERGSLLLVSGWWGISRHFHYVAEISLALAWTLPAGFSHLLPYTYVIFLTILLLDRSRRDEKRCRQKYGAYWEEYCQRVRYRIVPFVY